MYLMTYALLIIQLSQLPASRPTFLGLLWMYGGESMQTSCWNEFSKTKEDKNARYGDKPKSAEDDGWGSNG